MDEFFVVTGAGGFLGSEICRQLINMGKNVKALCLDTNDSFNVPEGVKVYIGDVLNASDIDALFCDTGIYYFIHCAGKISVKKKDEATFNINYLGTKNVIDACLKHKVKRLVYISSVDALDHSEYLETITEPDIFYLPNPKSEYAKSKSMAANAVLEACDAGLDGVVCIPSCIIGPGDTKGGFISTMFTTFLKGIPPVSIKGGYDFVDVRDVARGIIAACEKGKKKNSYLLSGSFHSVTEAFDIMAEHLGRTKTIIEFPGQILYLASPFVEAIAALKNTEPILNKYAIELLTSNIHFSNEKAKSCLGYEISSFKKSITDTIDFLEDEHK